jgi:endonuclease G
VLTNHHVLFPKKIKATKVHVEFGFDVDTNGGAVNGAPLVGDIGSIEGASEDDWAVVKVTGMDATTPTIDLAHARTPADGDRAYIVQHPQSQRKRLGYVRNMVTEVRAGRVQYMTDTQPGSSGSPVFDERGVLIALHHRGGTPTQEVGKAPVTKNEGIEIARVVAGLTAKGVSV